MKTGIEQDGGQIVDVVGAGEVGLEGVSSNLENRAVGGGFEDGGPRRGVSAVVDAVQVGVFPSTSSRQGGIVGAKDQVPGQGGQEGVELFLDLLQRAVNVGMVVFEGGEDQSP